MADMTLTAVTAHSNGTPNSASQPARTRTARREEKKCVVSMNVKRRGRVMLW